MTSPRRLAALAALIVLALFAVACGDDDDTAIGDDATPTAQPTEEPPAEPAEEPTDEATEEPTAEPTAEPIPEPTEETTEPAPADFPVTVSAANGDVTIDARPERIVSLSPTATEILFAIGAGDQVVAVDAASDFPEDAPGTDLSGFDTNVEALAQYEPDLVVVQFDPGELLSGLEALGVPAIVQPAALGLSDAYDQIGQLGVATGHIDAAADLVASMRADIAELQAQIPERSEPLTYYYELDPTFFTVTSDTFAGEILALAGMVSIADAADDAGSGFPQLSEEYILDADPDVIVLADTVCCAQTAETVADRPGWGELSAVASGRVIEVDDSLASRWGPRVVDFLEVIVAATADVEVGAS